MSPDRADAPADWVPVDRRFLGLDKRTILPAILILLLLIVYAGVLPAINDAVSFDREAKTGDVIVIGDGQVTFVPAVGWGIETGLLTSDPTRSGVAPPEAVVVNGAVTFTVSQGPFKGTPNELLSVINKTSTLDENQSFHVTSGKAAFTTSQGEEGAIESFTGTGSEGVLAALVFESLGVKVTAVGPLGAVKNQIDDVGAMIKSIRYEVKGA
jgi:hypothetical protein